MGVSHYVVKYSYPNLLIGIIVIVSDSVIIIIERSDGSVDIGCVGLARLLRPLKHLLGCCIYMYT